MLIHGNYCFMLTSETGQSAIHLVHVPIVVALNDDRLRFGSYPANAHPDARASYGAIGRTVGLSLGRVRRTMDP